MIKSSGLMEIIPQGLEWTTDPNTITVLILDMVSTQVPLCVQM
jgi:hypothetical protein